MMQRAINAKTKASLKSNIMIQNSDICCPRDYYLFNNISIKVQTHRITIKDPSSKKHKTKKIKPAYIDAIELIAQDKKDKKN